MREIKFRAWIKKEYDQCGGFMLYDPDNKSTDYFMVSNGTGFAVVFDEDWLKDDAYEIMQFTGLLDKNDKEIYEGDIVKTESGNYPVIYSEPCFNLGNDYDNDDYYQGSDPCCHNWKKFEVIGNIHENSELLEK